MKCFFKAILKTHFLSRLYLVRRLLLHWICTSVKFWQTCLCLTFHWFVLHYSFMSCTCFSCVLVSCYWLLRGQNNNKFYFDLSLMSEHQYSSEIILLPRPLVHKRHFVFSALNVFGDFMIWLWCFEARSASIQRVSYPSPVSGEHLRSSCPSRETESETGILGCFWAPEDSLLRLTPASGGRSEADSVASLFSPGRDK